MRRSTGILFAGLVLGLAACEVQRERPQRDQALSRCSDPSVSAQEALRFCQAALDDPRLDDANRALVHLNMGIASLALGRYRDSAAEHSQALDLRPGLAPAHLGRAQALDALDDVRGALLDYDAAIEADGQRAEAWLGRGTLLRRTGDASAAVDDLTQAVRLAPEWAAPRFERGGAYFVQGDYARALDDYNAALAIRPGDPATLVNRAKTLQAMGRAEAGRDFDAAIQAAPEWSTAFTARGAWHEAEGRTDAADADYLRAYALGETDPAIIERVRRLSGG